MNLDTEQIDAIVQAVLHQLQAQFGDVRSDREVSSMSSDPKNERVFGATRPSVDPPTSAPAGTLQVAGRLITSELLNGRLKGMQCLQVEERAVVTPLVRDLLRQAGIRLVRLAKPTAAKNDSAECCRLLLQDDKIVASRLVQAASAARSWQLVGSLEELLKPTLSAASSDRVCRVVVTPRWAEQVWSLSQAGGEPVVSVESKESVREARQQLNSRRFVVNSSRLNESQLALVLQEIANY